MKVKILFFSIVILMPYLSNPGPGRLGNINNAGESALAKTRKNWENLRF